MTNKVNKSGTAGEHSSFFKKIARSLEIFIVVGVGALAFVADVKLFSNEPILCILICWVIALYGFITTFYLAECRKVPSSAAE